MRHGDLVSLGGEYGESERLGDLVQQVPGKLCKLVYANMARSTQELSISPSFFKFRFRSKNVA